MQKRSLRSQINNTLKVTESISDQASETGSELESGNLRLFRVPSQSTSTDFSISPFWRAFLPGKACDCYLTA